MTYVIILNLYNNQNVMSNALLVLLLKSLLWREDWLQSSDRRPSSAYVHHTTLSLARSFERRSFDAD